MWSASVPQSCECGSAAAGPLCCDSERCMGRRDSRALLWFLSHVQPRGAASRSGRRSVPAHPERVGAVTVVQQLERVGRRLLRLPPEPAGVEVGPADRDELALLIAQRAIEIAGAVAEDAQIRDRAGLEGEVAL